MRRFKVGTFLGGVEEDGTFYIMHHGLDDHLELELSEVEDLDNLLTIMAARREIQDGDLTDREKSELKKDLMKLIIQLDAEAHDLGIEEIDE